MTNRYEQEVAETKAALLQNPIFFFWRWMDNILTDMAYGIVMSRWMQGD